MKTEIDIKTERDSWIFIYAITITLGFSLIMIFMGYITTPGVLI